MLQLLNYTNIRMVEQNSKMTAEMRELAKQNAEQTAEMKELAKQNAEQTAQNALQAQSMAVIAYDTKRDSEVMKAITVVTLIFLPGYFPLCKSDSTSGIDHLPFFLSRQSSAWGSSILIKARSRLSHQGRIYLGCAFPLTLVVLGASFTWIWWTGKKEEKPVDYSAGQVLAQAADTLRLGAGGRKEGV
jgi:hypothetical protein